jgi:presenilin-like A22 family membrane protease
MTIGYPSEEGTYSKLILDDGSSWYSEEIKDSTFPRANVGAWIVGFIIAVILMTLLYKWPEWYVVNTVGICVGSGVVVLLGVSFVPWLIILFMILAAVYDAWAVYKSKHMLDLADTMINLKLPILLVAPQDKGYSFIEDNPSEMRSNSDEGVKPPSVSGAAAGMPVPPHLAKKKGPEKDAMFMGLGDIIFPGMLVISAMTWLSGGSELFGISAPMLVAIGTLIGGLFGYFILMGFVALGRPQAGLPLLNGGSILGYAISAAIFIGSAAFELNITF